MPEWGRRTYVMGVINVTPDSFSGDGLVAAGDPADVFERVAQQAAHFAETGADMLDIGGESTRPGSVPVSAGEELARVIPAIVIPPSVLLIVYGATAGVSVVQLYAGAFFPGIMLAGLYVLYVIILAKLKPALMPPLPTPTPTDTGPTGMPTPTPAPTDPQPCSMAASASAAQGSAPAARPCRPSRARAFGAVFMSGHPRAVRGCITRAARSPA